MVRMKRQVAAGNSKEDKAAPGNVNDDKAAAAGDGKENEVGGRQR